MHQFAGWSKWLKRGFGIPPFFSFDRVSCVVASTTTHHRNSLQFQVLFHPLCRVLFIVRTVYFCTIGSTPDIQHLQRIHFAQTGFELYSQTILLRAFLFEHIRHSFFSIQREREEEEMLLMRQKKQRRNSKPSQTHTSVCVFLGVKSRRMRIWEMMMHFISSPRTKEDQPKKHRNSRELSSLFDKESPHREVLFRSVSVLQNDSSKWEKGGFHPPWPYPFQETQLFRWHRRRDPPFWALLVFLSVCRSNSKASLVSSWFCLLFTKT